MSSTSVNHSPWLADPAKETWLILAPSIIPVLVVLLFNQYFQTHEVSNWWWVILVLCIDVSHVYSTLFRMYWDRPTFQQYKKLLIIIPAVALIIGFALHLYSASVFWRILAYTAVFHFIRQQYGFMRLYSRKEEKTTIHKFVDNFSIYNATLYPLIYWHIHLTDQLNWFIKDDFISLNLAAYDKWILATYLLIIAAYTIKEVAVSLKRKQFNIPKNMIMIGTYASWYVGIVLFQGDLIFTLLNVVAHGIPYMGLIWIYGEKKSPSFNFGWKGVGIFVGLLLLLAYLEESIWDTFVWRDHPDVFPWLSAFDSITHSAALSLLVAILVLPQITHYVLDGFIWRFSKDKSARIAA